MRRSTMLRLERRLGAAEAAVARRWEDYSMQLLADAVNSADGTVRHALEHRLRRFYRAQTADPAWHDDPVMGYRLA